MNGMREWAGPYRPAAIALLGALFLVAIYRAATQSISHDEAVMYHWFQSAGSLSQMFDSPLGNHHPLTVLLSRISISLFGLSEFTQRLPSVLGAGLYFYTVFRICSLLIGPGSLFLLGVAFLSLNPFLLDYLSLSRGYSLGLAFFLYATYQLILYLSPDLDSRSPNRILNKAGVSMGLSIGCNVIMIFPAGAAALSFFALLIAGWLLSAPAPAAEILTAEQRRKGKKERKRRLRETGTAQAGRSAWQAMIHMAIPAVLVAGAVLIQPRRLVQLEEGYLGPPSLFGILEGIVRPSLLHSPSGFKGLAWLAPDLAISAVTYFVVPTLLISLILTSLTLARRWKLKRNFDALTLADRMLLFLGLALPAALALVVASRYVFAQPYPELRTVLYWIPLLSLAALALVDKLLAAGTTRSRNAAIGSIALLVLCVLQYVTQFNTRYFAEWAYCASTKDMMRIIRDQHAAAPPNTRVRVGANWELEPGINFYRIMWGLDWMDKVYRQSPDADFDYYLLLRDDILLIEKRHLTPLSKDDLARTALAKAGR
jgi:hypothetical protein